MLAELTNGLVERGHEVAILMPPQGDIEFNIKANIIRTLEPTIQEGDYPYSDYIISNYYTTVQAAELASINGKGMHIRLSLCYEPVFLPENDVTFPTYHVTSKIIVLSKWHQELINLNHGIKGKIVPVGVSSEFRNLQIRQPKDKIEVSAVIRKPEGGFSWHREQNYLLNHLDIVKQRYPNIQLNLFCPPDELASSPILQKIKGMGNYRFYTPANDVELCYHYNQADIFVNSSTYDTASLPGLEAMKCGAALVTTYAGGNLDYCNPDENCLLSYRYENNLSDNIIRLIHNPNLRQTLASRGEVEASNWTWERSIDRFLSAINSFALG
ncbi:glycosyltransferase family 4 protein [Pseudalkalibacillus hwajinpoensis]|uniref:glycosyltransferase family 4 protein n=1 Tax=Guptibacillus hwajinpoensis TaxID=208199 RepID=UPI00325BED99